MGNLTLTRARLSVAAAWPLVLLLAACGSRHEALPAQAASVGGIDLARLKRAETEPQQWLSAGGGWRGTHFSALSDINRDTVSRVGFAWEFDTGTRRGLEATPVIVDGVLFTSGVAGRVYALDAASGALRWRSIAASQSGRAESTSPASTAGFTASMPPTGGSSGRSTRSSIARARIPARVRR
jgi:glucose dehydrogenase